ncbi:probable integral membrane protein, putative [Microscilla marina ATCC 23134]|uniref:Probable integral membrane protein, putative n=2 Tax=Microscilla marina TaxID=1027 RepID=A1ZHJ0_MICM2|nr:probable integral membrane protein, putative [Microscilla marina ATCC 23134]
MLVCLSCAQQKGRGEAPNDEIPLDSMLFALGVSQGELQYKKIDEASGLVASRNNPHALWTHNDSGGKSRLFLIGDKGEHLAVYKLEGIKARDWEDITLGPGPKQGVNYLYVGDIGDNKARYEEKMIYRFPEPDVSNVSGGVKKKIEKSAIETIRFQFPDGNRDVEAMMIDPATKDIFFVTKREENVRMYVARYPQSTTELNQLEFIGTLPMHKIVAGDISLTGNEVLIKDYGNIYYWQKEENESIEEVLKTPPVRLPYEDEPQGESIAWKLDGSGYYTLSEKRFEIEPVLYFYKRK